MTRPRVSSATISPSRTKGPSSAASAVSASTISGNCGALSLPFRVHRRTPAADTSAMTRTPSHFGSIAHPASCSGNEPAGAASIGANRVERGDILPTDAAAVLSSSYQRGAAAGSGYDTTPGRNHIPRPFRCPQPLSPPSKRPIRILRRPVRPGWRALLLRIAVLRSAGASVLGDVALAVSPRGSLGRRLAVE